MKTQYEPPTLKYNTCSRVKRTVVLSLLLVVAISFQQCVEDRVKAPAQVSKTQQKQRIERLVDKVSTQLNARAVEIKKKDEDAWTYFTFDVVRNKRNGQVFLANIQEKRVADDDWGNAWSAIFAWDDKSGVENKIVVSCSNGTTTNCSTVYCAGKAVAKCIDVGNYVQICKVPDEMAAQTTIEEARGIEANDQLTEGEGENLDVQAGDTLNSATVTFYPTVPPHQVLEESLPTRD